jgi:hypothetical protein
MGFWLFKAIEGFDKLEQECGMRRILKSWWLLHIDIFIKNSM